MIDISTFKTAIIDLAVTGQLSAQFHVEDSVEEITSKLPPLSNKRKKLLGQSFEYGKQATLPEHWRWICLGEISSYGDTPKKAYFDDVSGDTWILDLEDIKSGGQIIKKTRVHGKKFIGDKTVFSEGQVLYSKLRPYLKKVLVADGNGTSTPELISFDTFGGMVPQYIVYCLLSTFTDRAIEKRSYGIKMPRIDAAFMVNLPIPVPPVSEQQFIVNRVKKAFSVLDTIDMLQAQYADNLTTLKSKLIDLAIQGKLTEQQPEDGTAEALYLQIQTEKQKKVMTGQVKRVKQLPQIVTEEIPFEMPLGWKWCRLESIFNFIDYRGATPNKTDHGIPFVTAKNVRQGYIDYSIKEYISEEDYRNRQSRGISHKGDLLFTTEAPMGYAAIADLEKFSAGQRLITLQQYTDNPSLDNRYYMYAISTIFFQKQLDEKCSGTTVKGIKADRLKEFLVPLPPLAEQRRIVAKLDEVLEIIKV